MSQASLSRGCHAHALASRCKGLFGILAAMILLCTYCFLTMVLNQQDDYAPLQARRTENELSSKSQQERNEDLHILPVIPRNKAISMNENSVAGAETAQVQINAFHHLDSSQLDRIRERFMERNRLISKMCQKITFKNITKPALQPYIDSFGNGRYNLCRIPKSASSYLNSLRTEIGGKYNFASAPNQTPMIIMVREPYSRVMSAYFGKIVTSPEFWHLFGGKIINKFRSGGKGQNMGCGKDVSFPEFVKFYVYSNKNNWELDHHFMPMSDVCNPCQRPIDLVAHLETFKEDIPYLLSMANLTCNGTLSDDVMTIRGKATKLYTQGFKSRVIERCSSFCTTIRSVWWSFQVRGLISEALPFPLDDSQCNAVSGEEFANISLEAHRQSVQVIDRFRQKREMMVKLYREVPLEDRINLQKTLDQDFKLFGYDPQPPDLFPELV